MNGLSKENLLIHVRNTMRSLIAQNYNIPNIRKLATQALPRLVQAMLNGSSCIALSIHHQVDSIKPLVELSETAISVSLKFNSPINCNTRSRNWMNRVYNLGPEYAKKLLVQSRLFQPLIKWKIYFIQIIGRRIQSINKWIYNQSNPFATETTITVPQPQFTSWARRLQNIRLILQNNN